MKVLQLQKTVSPRGKSYFSFSGQINPALRHRTLFSLHSQKIVGDVIIRIHVVSLSKY